MCALLVIKQQMSSFFQCWYTNQMIIPKISIRAYHLTGLLILPPQNILIGNHGTNTYTNSLFSVVLHLSIGRCWFQMAMAATSATVWWVYLSRTISRLLFSRPVTLSIISPIIMEHKTSSQLCISDSNPTFTSITP